MLSFQGFLTQLCLTFSDKVGHCEKKLKLNDSHVGRMSKIYESYFRLHLYLAFRSPRKNASSLPVKGPPPIANHNGKHHLNLNLKFDVFFLRCLSAFNLP